MAARVATMEGTPSSVTSAPLRQPNSAPAERGQKAVTRQGHAGFRERSRDHAGHRELRAHRDIDLARDDDQRHADGDNQRGRVADGDVADIGEGEERRARAQASTTSSTAQKMAIAMARCLH